MATRKKKELLVSENQDCVTLSPSEGAELVYGLYKSGAYDRPPLFRGKPGIGKTSFVYEAYLRLKEENPDFQYIELNPTMPADEICGLPDVIRTEGAPSRTTYAVPTWWPMDPLSCGILCLDDMMQGDKFTQTTLANLVHAKNLRGHQLPVGWMIVGTGNRAEDNAGSNKMLSHLGDRMTPFNIEADAASWIENFALPNGVDDRVISYIEQNPDKLNMFDPKKEKCPTSRTWTAVSKRLGYIDSIKDTPYYEKFAQAIVIGELGMAEGSLFWQYCGIADQIPNIDDILANPTTASVDYELDVKYATAVRIAKEMTLETFANALTYVDRLDPDVTPMVIKLGTRNKPDLAETQEFADWATKQQELFCGIAA